MLHPTQQIFVIKRMKVQIVECLDLITMLEIMITALFGMIFYDHKFLTFVFRKFPFKFELFLCKIKCFTNCSF